MFHCIIIVSEEEEEEEGEGEGFSKQTAKNEVGAGRDRATPTSLRHRRRTLKCSGCVWRRKWCVKRRRRQRRRRRVNCCCLSIVNDTVMYGLAYKFFVGAVNKSDAAHES